MAQLPVQPVVFVLTKLPFKLEDDCPINPGNPLPSIFEGRAAEYLSALQAILSSPLNRAGRISTVVFDFAGYGWFQISPQNYYLEDVTESRFITMLSQLFEHGQLLHNGTPVWKSLPNITRFFNDLPPLNNVIGCTSGPSSVRTDVTEYAAYLSTANFRRRTQVFLMGDFEEGEIASFITAKIIVSTYTLAAGMMASNLCNAVGMSMGLV